MSFLGLRSGSLLDRLYSSVILLTWFGVSLTTEINCVGIEAVMNFFLFNVEAARFFFSYKKDAMSLLLDFYILYECFSNFGTSESAVTTQAASPPPPEFLIQWV